MTFPVIVAMPDNLDGLTPGERHLFEVAYLSVLAVLGMAIALNVLERVRKRWRRRVSDRRWNIQRSTRRG